MRMKWNLLRAMLVSSVVMMFAAIYLMWNLHYNNYFDLGHMLLLSGWIPLWTTLSLMKKETLKKPLTFSIKRSGVKSGVSN
jgi:ABC-type sugar transport system permease subunit